MITKNDWLKNNLHERFTNKAADFNVVMNPYPFKNVSFDEAVKNTIEEISNNYGQLYLGLSGGCDSDFVMQAFHKHGVPIVPVIACCGNEKENVYAFKTCKRLNVEPVFIQIKDDEFLDCFEKSIYEPFNGVGYNSTQNMFICDYVRKQKGTLLIAEHLLGDGDDIITNSNFAFSNEWDYYHPHYFSDLVTFDFFLYSAELSYSMMPHHLPNISWAQYKSELYGTEYREKIRPIYSTEVSLYIEELKYNRRPILKKTGVVWSRDDINKIFNGVIHD